MNRISYQNMSYQIEGRRYSPEAPDERSEAFACPQLPQIPRKKKNITKNNRRFNDEQIRLLESIFESETKLEPRKKLQLAGELGLQPRQVAIWFQNRRARWKSKQIEQEYKTLRANYENLASCFESLKNERESLLIELQKLNELLAQPCGRNRTCNGLEWSNTVIDSDNGNINSDPEAQELDNKSCICTQNNISRDIGHSGDEGYERMNSDEYTDGSLASPDQWYSLDSDGHYDLPSSSAQGFNFWT